MLLCTTIDANENLMKICWTDFDNYDDDDWWWWCTVIRKALSTFTSKFTLSNVALHNSTMPIYKNVELTMAAFMMIMMVDIKWQLWWLVMVDSRQPQAPFQITPLWAMLLCTAIWWQWEWDVESFERNLRLFAEYLCVTLLPWLQLLKSLYFQW